jgi:hypothetical protein
MIQTIADVQAKNASSKAELKRPPTSSCRQRKRQAITRR